VEYPAIKIRIGRRMSMPGKPPLENEQRVVLRPFLDDRQSHQERGHKEIRFPLRVRSFQMQLGHFSREGGLAIGRKLLLEHLKLLEPLRTVPARHRVSLSASKSVEFQDRYVGNSHGGIKCFVSNGP
jgi:hypothetical protein